jgi:8-amino-7-oxononanoate synthase
LRLASQDDVIFSDELNHASIIDGCRISKGKVIIYKHNDMQDLEQKLQQFTDTHKGHEKM